MDNDSNNPIGQDSNKREKKLEKKLNKDEAIIEEYKEKKHSKRRILLYLIFLVAGIVIIAFWWIHYKAYITTTDAYLASERINVGSEMLGNIDKLYVSEQSKVQIGDTLFTIKDDNGWQEFVVSPIQGDVAKVWLLKGDLVKKGQTVLTLNEHGPIWVNVFLEETKLSDIYLNQEVDIQLMAYPELEIKGRIFYIGKNTASQFTLIAPSNAAGNYTRVTQRIPIRVSIESISNDKMYTHGVHLVSGLSAKVLIKRTKTKSK
ncbi:MAG: efflux RND transporter periplasmic adaptor subunit [Marinifilaceae bacterium]